MSKSFQRTGRPLARSLIIAVARSNSSTFTGLSPIVRRAESPRPMPITMRPAEIAWSVANALAVTVGSRVPGFVTFSPSLSVDVSSAAIVNSGYGSCQRLCESYVQPYSKPCCSASLSSSATRRAGGSGSTVTPKLNTRIASLEQHETVAMDCLDPAGSAVEVTRRGARDALGEDAAVRADQLDGVSRLEATLGGGDADGEHAR